MANTILTPTAVTREALRILHQKLNFIGNCTRTYDDSFGQAGAKIGTTLNIRLPNQYTVRTGTALSAQDTTETSTSLVVSTQKGVDLNFTSQDLTLSLDDFSQRILEPAMAVLAANVEADAFNMALDVYNNVNNVGSALSFLNVMQARKVLNDNLAPMDDNRNVILNTQDNVDLVNALKGLFQDSGTIAKQYREGIMGKTGGFTFYENTILPTQATGTAPTATTYTVNGAGQTGSSIAIQTGTGTFNKGDIITFAGCNRCHPETKADTGVLQQFVVTATTGTSATAVSVSPAIVTTGGLQNVVASPSNTGAVTKVATVGGGASQVYKPSLAFHQDAFAFATADLVMPDGVDFAARENYDGIALRIVRAYDINNDKFPCRLDILYGYKTIRPQLACRILSN